MKIEQKLVTLYTVMGVLCGILSNYLMSNLMFALLLPVACYLGSIVMVIKMVKERKLRMIISNSLITFFAVWITMWVFLYNL
jgi:hypothetical protein